MEQEPGEVRLRPLPEPVLHKGVKLCPYEERYFGTPGLAQNLGYTEDLKSFYSADQMKDFAWMNMVDARIDAIRMDRMSQRHRFEDVLASCGVLTADRDFMLERIFGPAQADPVKGEVPTLEQMRELFSAKPSGIT